jgi:hypothetical protein
VLGATVRHGAGTHVSANGARYEGAWRLDQRHGRGKFRAADGCEYVGEWRHDRAHG